jgi:hypothetical protein
MSGTRHLRHPPQPSVQSRDNTAFQVNWEQVERA